MPAGERRLGHFARGFRLLREMARRPMSRSDAEAILGIPTREWHRWLAAFRKLDIPLIETRSDERHKLYRIRRADWLNLLGEPGKRARRGTRRPCKHGHEGEWFLNDEGFAACRACGREYVARFRVRQAAAESPSDKELRREKRRSKYQASPEIRERARKESAAYYERNKKAILARAKRKFRALKKKRARAMKSERTIGREET